MQPVIICRIPVEIPTMPILAWLTRHRDPHIDVTSFPRLIPPVDLNLHTTGHCNVHNMECLTLSSILHSRSRAVVMDLDQVIRQIGWKRRDYCLSIPRCSQCGETENIALQEWATKNNLLCHRKATGHVGWPVASLNVDLLTFRTSILLMCVEVHPLMVK